jgi:hypothetical protein
MISKMKFTLSAAFILFFFGASSAENTIKTVLEGSSLTLFCPTTYPPAWIWSGKSSIKPLAHGIKPYPSLQEPRYAFLQA